MNLTRYCATTAPAPPKRIPLFTVFIVLLLTHCSNGLNCSMCRLRMSICLCLWYNNSCNIKLLILIVCSLYFCMERENTLKGFSHLKSLPLGYSKSSQFDTITSIYPIMTVGTEYLQIRTLTQGLVIYGVKHEGMNTQDYLLL